MLVLDSDLKDISFSDIIILTYRKSHQEDLFDLNQAKLTGRDGDNWSSGFLGDPFNLHFKANQNFP